jgi:hypothetical protein
LVKGNGPSYLVSKANILWLEVQDGKETNCVFYWVQNIPLLYMYEMLK